jgi:hypothetical protein
MYQGNSEDVKRIHAMILSGDISDDDSTDYGKECDDNYVELEERDSGLCRRCYVASINVNLGI